MDKTVSGDNNGVGITKFFTSKNILITGSTGFLGKVLVEKILRTIPEVNKLYLLIRAESKEDAIKRVQTEIIDEELFKNLRRQHGESYQDFMRNKLVPVVGDVCDPDIISSKHLTNEIAEKLDMIINSSANTNFDERYDDSLEINTRGPCHLMVFAKKCKKIKIFVHFSTAYVNRSQEGIAMEKQFQNSKAIIDMDNELESDLNYKIEFGKEVVGERMKELGLERAKKHGWQDVYSFTKAMGEMMIDHTRGNIPIVIMRPSIVESTLKEPFLGWIQGNRMMDPLIILYGKGVLKGFPVDPKSPVDVIPVDMVVNSTLAAAAKHGTNPKPGSINVYQITSSVANPLIYQDLLKSVYQHFKAYPVMDPNNIPIRLSPVKIFQSEEEHILDHEHKQPEKRDKKMMQKIKYLADLYKPYTFYKGRFDNSNIERLIKEMSGEERRDFDFDVKKIKWNEYIENVHIPGLRRFVLKEKFDAFTSKL